MGNGTDLWRITDDFRAGLITAEQYAQLEVGATPTFGHCTEMGTASTMAAICEALGMALRGSSTIPAVHAARLGAAELTGKVAVTMALASATPSMIMTTKAFDNAITTLMAAGGSTNAVIHILAIAGRLGIDLNLQRFDDIARTTPTLADIRPVGHGLFEDLHQAGGVPALHAALGDRIHNDVVTVSDYLPDDSRGTLAAVSRHASAIIASPQAPVVTGPALAVVRGSLAPRGAIIKRAAASAELLAHRGPALVFDGIDDLLERIDDPDLPVDANTVLILRGVGPIGGPGMPEWGQLPIPSKLLRLGVRDMVRISDARMSGTAFGTAVLHVSPESVVGGPLAAVQDGDIIVLDTDAGVLDLDIPAAELERRIGQLGTSTVPPSRGYAALHAGHVGQADEGCDFDFLRGVANDNQAEPAVLAGWIGGW